MKTTLIVIMSFVALVMMSFVITADKPRYKNLKILPRDITKEQLDSVMKHFARSLGVKCSYCHQYNQEQKAMDFASDAKKEKASARSMWRMMTKLNKKAFDVKNSRTLDAKLEVTCFTCHHGQEHPGTKPPPMPQGPPGQQQGPPGQQQGPPGQQQGPPGQQQAQPGQQQAQPGQPGAAQGQPTPSDHKQQ